MSEHKKRFESELENFFTKEDLREARSADELAAIIGLAVFLIVLFLFAAG